MTRHPHQDAFAATLLLSVLHLGAAAPLQTLPDSQEASEVRVEFGASNRELGLHTVEVGDSKHALGTLDDEEAWLFQAGWNYCYFLIDPAFKRTLGSNAVVRVEYRVVRGNPIGLQYDNGRNTYAAATVTSWERQKWDVIKFTLPGASFRNSQNGRADFRLYDNEKGFFLKSVSVSRYERKPLRVRLRDLSTSSNLLDLTTFYNASLRNYAPAGNPDNMTNVLANVFQWTGVNFDSRGYIGLYRKGDAPGAGASPKEVNGIPIGRRVGKMHFLQSASYGEREGTQIGSYFMHMSDGSREELALVYGDNVRSERGDYKATPGAEIAWEGTGITNLAGGRVRIYKTTWVNPKPEVVVTSLDFASTSTKSSPHLLAVTVE